MKRTDWLVAVTIALCAVGLFACGGGGDGGDGGGAAAREEAALEFAECVRAHGVAIEDPQPGENIVIEGDRDPRTRRALAACDGKLAGVAQQASPAEDAEFREGWLAFTECMRAEGIELADPQFLGVEKVHLGIAGVDTGSPAFAAAAEACKEELPESNGIGVGG